MRLTFDDDRAYEAFQFIWFGLVKTQLQANVGQMATLHLLLSKLAKISKEHEGGRVLIGECEVELSQDEQILALDAIAHTPWQPAVFPQVRRACEFLGAEFQQPAPA